MFVRFPYSVFDLLSNCNFLSGLDFLTKEFRVTELDLEVTVKIPCSGKSAVLQVTHLELWAQKSVNHDGPILIDQIWRLAPAGLSSITWSPILPIQSNIKYYSAQHWICELSNHYPQIKLFEEFEFPMRSSIPMWHFFSFGILVGNVKVKIELVDFWICFW